MRALHVKFIFCLRLNVLREFAQDFPHVAGKANCDWKSAAECAAIPVELRKSQDFLADGHGWRVSVMFNDLQRSGNAFPWITSKVWNIAITVNEVIPTTQLDDSPTKRRFLPDSHEPRLACFEREKVVVIDVSQRFPHSSSLFGPIARSLVYHD